MEDLCKVTFEEPSVAKLASSGIRVIKDRTLLAPGFWNGRNYTKEEISKAFNTTDWNDKDVVSLIADHRDDDSKGRPLTIRDWLGYVSNQYLTDDGFVKGDLNLCDADLALRLIDGKAPFGISPFVYGKFDKLENAQKDFIFRNFAVVVEPACKESFINDYLEDDGLSEPVKELSINERISMKLSETVASDIKGKSVDSSGLQPVKSKKKKKKSDLKKMKGGLTNMEEEKQKMEDEQVEETVKEETVEEAKEETVEEPKEESKEEEKTEEEESEEKLMEQLAAITEKLMNKRKITPEQAKMQKLESEIASLRKEMQKLQEESKEEESKEEESKEEESKEESEEESEKLTARALSVPKTIEGGEGFKMFAKEIGEGSKELASMLGYN